MRAAAALCALGACAAPAADLLPGATPLACTPISTTFRIDRVAVPVDTDAATEAGIDLDGDGTSDNMAGWAIAAGVVSYADLAAHLQARWDARFTDDTDWQIRIERCDGESRVTLSGGAASETVAAAGDAVDSGAGVAVRARDGVGVAPLGALAELDGDGPVEWVQAYPVVADVTIASDELTGKIDGGVGPGYREKLAAAFQPYLQARLDAGEASIYDANDDGTIAFDELLYNPDFEIITGADLDVLGGPIDPPNRPSRDGERESFSFGFAIHATAL